MSYNIKEDTFVPDGAMGAFPQQPVDLKQENMRLFDQLNNGFYQVPHGYVAHNGPLTNLWRSPESSELFDSRNMLLGVVLNGYNGDLVAPNGHGDYIDAPVIFENGSVSSMSLPSFMNGNLANSTTGQSVLDAKDVSQESDSGRKKTKAKKPFLTEQESILLDRDDSELSDKELAIKKKAQNRLAQRAFRERKESKLKELENKLLESEGERQKLLEKLDEIKLQYISMRTENRLLRNTSDNQASAPSYGVNLENARFVFPQSQEEFIAEMVDQKNHNIKPATVNKVYDEPQNPGRKVLVVGAVWDYLQIKAEEEEYENIDMMEVMALLKGKEACHGYGPAYPLDLVDSALHQVVERLGEY